MVGVGGSNPLATTKYKKCRFERHFFVSEASVSVINIPLTRSNQSRSMSGR